ncbi:MAG: hypothetical protein ACD_79C00698G0003 [uncultured bacterium]|nr:MAG: hypothetical protein ACD_79C00698G0003 [uncultured bacterium]
MFIFPFLERIFITSTTSMFFSSKETLSDLGLVLLLPFVGVASAGFTLGEAGSSVASSASSIGRGGGIRPSCSPSGCS